MFDDPDDDDFIQGCMDNFRAREGESGVSLWLLPPDEQRRDQVLAAFATLRSRLQKLRYLKIPASCFESVGIEPRQIDPEAGFDCVSSCHYEIEQPDEDALRAFSRCIQRHLRDDPALFTRQSKKQMGDVLARADASCRDVEGEATYDDADLPDWAVEALGLSV